MVFKISCSKKDDAFTLMKAFAQYRMKTVMYPVFVCHGDSASAKFEDRVGDKIIESYEVDVNYSPCSFDDDYKKETSEIFERVFRNIYDEHKNELSISGEYEIINSTYCVINFFDKALSKEELIEIINSRM